MRTVAFALFSLFVLQPPSFNGCSKREVEPEPLPMSTACTEDIECVDDDPCSDTRCYAGTCVTVSETVDRDGDGDPPIECGGLDCNDTDPNIFAGAFDLCDGVDTDCDSRFDEDEPVAERRVAPPLTDGLGTVVRWGNGFALTEASLGAVWIHAVRADGSLGTPNEIMRLSAGGAFERIDAVNAADGDRVLILAQTDIGAVRIAVIEPGDSRDELVFRREPETLDLGGPARVDGAVIPFGGSFAFVARQGGVAQLFASLTGDAIQTLDVTEAIQSLATDGEHLFVALDGEVAVFRESGRAIADARVSVVPGGLLSGAGFAISVGESGEVGELLSTGEEVPRARVERVIAAARLDRERISLVFNSDEFFSVSIWDADYNERASFLLTNPMRGARMSVAAFEDNYAAYVPDSVQPELFLRFVCDAS